MLARIVESWLIDAGERGYQTPFAQVLASEAYRILHGPAHHPYEHGKDISAMSASGDLHAFQLKGGDIGLTELEQIQGQLFALAATAVTYPGVEPPRRPDRTFLVTSGQLSPPARDRLRSLNDGNRPLGLAPIEVIEREQLVSRFLAAHGNYFPSEPHDLNRFLEILLDDGRGPFPVEGFAAFLNELVGLAGAQPKPAQLRRALASATVFTAYAAGPWQRNANHLGVAQAWLVAAATVLRFAEKHDLNEDAWKLSFELTRDAARAALRDLLDEASTRDDLIIPDLVEGIVYPTRALLVCGYCAAFYLSEREFGDGRLIEEGIKRLLQRELEFVQAPGEAGAPLLLMIANALQALGDPVGARNIVAQWALGIVEANQPDSANALPDPYHSLEDVLLSLTGAETPMEGERFDGYAYSVHVALEWMVRRELRKTATHLWPAVTRIHFCEFQLSAPCELLGPADDNGRLHSWDLQTPTSWSALRHESGRVAESVLPSRLWRELYFLPYIPVLFPQRLTSAVSKAIDYMIAPDLCEIDFSDPTAEPTTDSAK